MSNLPTPSSPSPELTTPPLAGLAEVPRDVTPHAGGSGFDQALRYWLAVRRYAVHIVLLCVTTTAIAALLVYRIPKQYTSSTVVRVDPDTPDTVVAGNANAETEEEDMYTLLNTDAKEILSSAVMAPALQAAGLGPGAPESVTADVMPGTNLLQIQTRAASPAAARDLAQAVAQQFLDHEFTTRSNALKDLSGYMRAQMDDLRARMEKSQLALNQFEAGNNLADPQGKFDLNQQQLSTLAGELSNERAKQRELQSELTLVEANNVDALLVSDRGQSLQPLEEAKKNAELQFAQLAAQYGPGNYLYQQAQRQVQKIDDLIAAQESDIGAQIRAEAAQNNAEVKATQAAYDAAYATLQASDAKEVQYSILKGEADSDQALYNDLIQKLNAADVSMGYRSDALRIVEPASLDSVPVYPRPGLTLALVALLALIAGCGLALAASGFDRTFTSPEAVRLAVGETLLASLPLLDADTASLLASEEQAGQRSLYAEAVLGLRTALLLGGAGKARALMLASAQPQEGKSTTAINLATAYAVLGLRTVLVDADIRRPQVHRQFDISNRVGLTSLLQRKASLEDCLFPAKIANLFLLPAGPAAINPTELLALSFGNALEELKAEFDCIIVDTPPLLDFADARTVAACVDACVLVVRAGATPRALVVSAVQELRQVRARIGGIVLNAINPQMSHYYHYRGSYGAGREYYRRDEDEGDSTDNGGKAALAAAASDTETGQERER